MKWSNGENILYYSLAVSAEGQPGDRRSDQREPEVVLAWVGCVIESKRSYVGNHQFPKPVSDEQPL